MGESRRKMAEASAEPSSGGWLPDELATVIPERLGWASLIYIGLSAAFWLVGLLGISAAAENSVNQFVAPAGIAVSLGVFLLARFGGLAPQVASWVGMAFQITICTGLAFMANVHPWPQHALMSGWSPVAVWILLYSVMVPNTIGRTALAGTLCALMDPISLFALRLRDGVPLPETSLIVQRFLPDVAAVACAILLSRLLYQLGERVDEARKMGSYELKKLLGRGGMGEVWTATHTNLARPAAVKLIRPERLDTDRPHQAETMILRFRKEVQTTASLRSPHTIEVYEFGMASSGAFYYVMELLDGIDLHSLVTKHGAQPAERVAFLMSQVCHSLNEAHEAGLVHRDIKPANIFMCRYGADLDFVKVLDFGLVKGDAPGEDHASLTRAGAHIGTPAFMPPEIALGTGDAIDGRADLYAVGCVAYWLLTGELVFELAAPMKMVQMHASQTPIRPSERRGELDIPEELEAIVMRCLAKKPEDRPSTARALAEELEATGIARRWSFERQTEWWGTRGPAPMSTIPGPTSTKPGAPSSRRK